MKRKNIMTVEGRKKISEFRKGFKFSIETRNKMSETRKKNKEIRGEKAYQWKGGLPKCIECSKILSRYDAKRCRECFGKVCGENHPLWKGGLTELSLRIRHSARYREWRESIFKRDNYTCQGCGKIGGNLNADHLKPFSLYPELRFDLSNGRTLCIECHKKTDSYLSRIYSYKRTNLVVQN